MTSAVYKPQAARGKVGAEDVVLDIQHLSKVFVSGRRRVHAVTDFNLTVKRGEVVGLVGESGSGKSTVARLVARLYEPTGGRVILNGRELPRGAGGRAVRDYRRFVQMIFQDPFSSLNPLHTIEYMLERPLAIHNLVPARDRGQKVRELLERCGLAPADTYAHKYPTELSGGQRQRVGIARALAASPSLILADEPTSMLDVSIRLDIMNLLLDLRDQEQLSYLFITHDLAGARYVSDRIVVMYAGNLVEVGPSADVITAPLMPYTSLLKSAAPKPETGLSPERVEARGEVPDLASLPPGCPFEPRCPFSRPACREKLPDLLNVGSRGQQVRCVLYDPKVMNGRPLDERGIDASLAEGLIVENDAPPAPSGARA